MPRLPGLSALLRNVRARSGQIQRTTSQRGCYHRGNILQLVSDLARISDNAQDKKGTLATEVISDSARAAQLRGRLTDDMVVEGTIVSNEVEAAFRTVPRHLFAPGTTLEQSYAQDAVRTKRDQHGTTISSISAPWLQAMMLEQAGLRPGMRVLEIGSGGYNAALIAELVGADGAVTTVDIDPDVVDRARSCLAEAGYSRVHVVLADAEGGCRSTHPTTGSSSRPGRGTSPRPGRTSLPRAGPSPSPCGCGA